MTITWQTIITFGAALAVIVTLFKYLSKIYDLIKHQKEQDEHIKDIMEEQSISTESILAILKGLVELGCDGVVKEQITKTENYLNRKAHKV